MKRYFVALVVILFLSVPALAQTRRQNDGYTRADVRPGAVAGSYPLSDITQIDLFSRSINFAFPLASLSGRGDVPVTLPLAIDPKFYAVYDAALNKYYLGHPTSQYVFRIPTLRGERIQDPAYASTDECMTQSYPSSLLTRFYFADSTGAEYVFHDTATNGTPYSNSNLCVSFAGSNRGKVFVTSDATAATLIFDNDVIDQYQAFSSSAPYEAAINATVITRDGTRYRFESGKLVWIRDRNGNQAEYQYNSGVFSSIKDSIGRTITNPAQHSIIRHYDDPS